ncbi:hypothetical protein [Methanogenium sp. MK-MG]|uniref:hypothetical protein n=1 Tax=Methanogenium sp. MK-MG TaxID=2599926 RepID=UPI0013EE0FB6|nr:hypothetical protein [Methanogenium sp. MK-MG]KAF1077251.1 hypothetical protein MKMG_01292 [Methanogenium sp. MK-MG]
MMIFFISSLIRNSAETILPTRTGPPDNFSDAESPNVSIPDYHNRSLHGAGEVAGADISSSLCYLACVL